MITPTESTGHASFNEVLDGEATTYPPSPCDLDLAHRADPALTAGMCSFGDGEDCKHLLADGMIIYYCVEAEIPPRRKTIGGDRIVRRKVWVRGSYTCPQAYSHWDPPEEPEPDNPDGDTACFTSLKEAVHYTLLERYSRELWEIDNHCHACGGTAGAEDIYGTLVRCEKCDNQGWLSRETPPSDVS